MPVLPQRAPLQILVGRRRRPFAGRLKSRPNDTTVVSTGPYNPMDRRMSAAGHQPNYSPRASLVRFPRERTTHAPPTPARNAALPSSRPSVAPPLGPRVGTRLLYSMTSSARSRTEPQMTSIVGEAPSRATKPTAVVGYILIIPVQASDPFPVVFLEGFGERGLRCFVPCAAITRNDRDQAYPLN